MGDKRNPPSVLQDWRGEQLLLWGRHKALPVLYSKEKKKKDLHLFEGEETLSHPKVQVETCCG